MGPLPLPFDREFAEKSQPSLREVRELIGVDDGVPVEFVACIPVLSQGAAPGIEWAYVVKDGSTNRYLLMTNHHCRWYVADQQELRDLTHLYATASQVAVRGLIELTEGAQQDAARLRRDALKSLGLTIDQEQIEASPELSKAVSALVDAAEVEIKKRDDGKA